MIIWFSNKLLIILVLTEISFFPNKEYIPRPEKRHEFPYKREMDRNEIDKNKIMTNANIVRNEFKLFYN